MAVLALVLGITAGQLLAFAAPMLFGISGGSGAVAVALLAFALMMFVLERLRPRSGVPVAIAAVSALLATGPIGLYYVLPAVFLVTPIALYRALQQKYAP